MAQADAILIQARRDPAVLAASFTANLLALALPMSMIHIYDRVIPREGYETLAALGIMVIIALAAELALRAARHHLLTLAAEKFEVDAHVSAVRALLMSDPGRTTHESEGQIYRQFSGIDRLRGLHVGDTAIAILDLPFALLFLAIVILISPLAGISVFVLLSVAFIALRFSRGTVLQLQIERQDIEARRHSFVSEVLRGMDAIKNLQTGDFMLRRYEKLLSGSVEKSASLARSVQMAQGLTAGVGTLAPLFIAAVGSYQVIQDQITVGALAAIVLLTGRIVQPILRVEAFLAGEENSRQARQDVDELLNLPQKKSGTAKPQTIGTLVVDIKETRQVEDVDGLAFENVSLRLKRGDCIDLRGPDPSSTSAFLRLLAGEVAVSDGSILINGLSVEDIDLDVRQRKLTLLSKDDLLLTGTLLENLTAFKPALYRTRAMELMRELGVETYFSQSPDGFGMEVGRGTSEKIPKSLADAVNIAGGLVTDPDVLLFDEANIALDIETDQNLRKLLDRQKQDRITVIVSNRPSFRALATRVIDISTSVIVADSKSGVV